MAEVILTVTPNPAVDVTYHLDELRPGAVHRVDDVACRAGGKGVNVARVLQRLGVPSEAVLLGSGGVAARIVAELAVDGVPATSVGRMKVRRTVVVHARDGTTTALWEPGSAPDDPAAAVSELLAVVADRLDRTGPERPEAITVSGSLPPGVPPGVPARIGALAAAAGVPAVLDLDGPALAAAVAGGTAVLTPNTDELERLTGRSPASVPDVVALVTGLAATAVPLVVATLGGDGLVVARRGAPAVHAVLSRPVDGNPTGAGDAVVAAVAAHLAEVGSAERVDVEELARRAVAAGAAAVLRPLAGEVDPGDVARLLAAVEVRPA